MEAAFDVRVWDPAAGTRGRERPPRALCSVSPSTCLVAVAVADPPPRGPRLLHLLHPEEGGVLFTVALPPEMSRRELVGLHWVPLTEPPAHAHARHVLAVVDAAGGVAAARPVGGPGAPGWECAAVRGATPAMGRVVASHAVSHPSLFRLPPLDEAAQAFEGRQGLLPLLCAGGPGGVATARADAVGAMRRAVEAARSLGAAAPAAPEPPAPAPPPPSGLFLAFDSGSSCVVTAPAPAPGPAPGPPGGGAWGEVRLEQLAPAEPSARAARPPPPPRAAAAAAAAARDGSLVVVVAPEALLGGAGAAEVTVRRYGGVLGGAAGGPRGARRLRKDAEGVPWAVPEWTSRVGVGAVAGAGVAGVALCPAGARVVVACVHAAGEGAACSLATLGGGAEEGSWALAAAGGGAAAATFPARLAGPPPRLSASQCGRVVAASWPSGDAGSASGLLVVGAAGGLRPAGGDPAAGPGEAVALSGAGVLLVGARCEGGDVAVRASVAAGELAPPRGGGDGEPGAGGRRGEGGEGALAAAAVWGMVHGWDGPDWVVALRLWLSAALSLGRAPPAPEAPAGAAAQRRLLLTLGDVTKTFGRLERWLVERPGALDGAERPPPRGYSCAVEWLDRQKLKVLGVLPGDWDWRAGRETSRDVLVRSLVAARMDLELRATLRAADAALGAMTGISGHGDAGWVAAMARDEAEAAVMAIGTAETVSHFNALQGVFLEALAAWVAARRALGPAGGAPGGAGPGWDPVREASCDAVPFVRCAFDLDFLHFMGHLQGRFLAVADQFVVHFAAEVRASAEARARDQLLSQGMLEIDLLDPDGGRDPEFVAELERRVAEAVADPGGIVAKLAQARGDLAAASRRWRAVVEALLLPQVAAAERAGAPGAGPPAPARCRAEGLRGIVHLHHAPVVRPAGAVPFRADAEAAARALAGAAGGAPPAGADAGALVRGVWARAAELLRRPLELAGGAGGPRVAVRAARDPPGAGAPAPADAFAGWLAGRACSGGAPCGRAAGQGRGTADGPAGAPPAGAAAAEMPEVGGIPLLGRRRRVAWGGRAGAAKRRPPPGEAAAPPDGADGAAEWVGLSAAITSAGGAVRAVPPPAGVVVAAPGGALAPAVGLAVCAWCRSVAEVREAGAGHALGPLVPARDAGVGADGCHLCGGRWVAVGGGPAPVPSA